MAYNGPFSHTLTYTGGGHHAGGHSSDHRTSTDRIQSGSHLKSDYLGFQSKEWSPYNSRSTSPLTASNPDNQRKSKFPAELTEFDRHQRKTQLSPEASTQSDVVQLIEYAKKIQSLKIGEIEKEIEDLKEAEQKEQRRGDQNNVREVKQLTEKLLALQETHDSFQKKYMQAVEDKNEFEEKFKKLHDEFKAKEKEIKYLERVVSKNDEDLKRLRSEKDQELKQLRTDKDLALSRLSKEMGDKLNKENTAIADLSDPNRSTKVAELYNSIYDNEWTDALETLQSCGLDEEHAIGSLLEIIRSIYDFCTKTKEDHLEQLQMHILNPFSQRQTFFQENPSKTKAKDQIRKLLMDCIKLNAKEMVSDLKSSYLAMNLKPSHSQRVPEYVGKVMELCWLMLMCSPPLVFCNAPRTGEALDKNLFKEYTKQGDVVSFVVWLPLLIEKDGPVLTKGVVQPIPSVTKFGRSVGKDRTGAKRDVKIDRQNKQETKDNTDDMVDDFFHSSGTGGRVYRTANPEPHLGTKESLYGNGKSSGFSRKSESEENKPMSDYMKSYHEKSNSNFESPKRTEATTTEGDLRQRERFLSDVNYGRYDNKGYDTHFQQNISDTRTGSRDPYSQTSSRSSSDRYTGTASRGDERVMPTIKIDNVEYGYHNGRLAMRAPPDYKWYYVK